MPRLCDYSNVDSHIPPYSGYRATVRTLELLRSNESMQKIYGILRKLNRLKKQENQLETGMEMGSKKPLLSFRAEPVCDLLGDQGALPPARLLIMR